MNDFDKVFADDIEDEVNFDTLFNNDSDLIDLIGSHILESAEEYHCYNKKCEDDKDDDDEDDIEEISSNNDPSQDGAEGVNPVKEKCGGNTVKEKCGSNDDTVKEKCGGCSRKENCYGDQCDNEVPAVNTTADLDKVLHSDNYSNSVVDSPKDVIAPAINIPQNTTDLDKIMNNEPGPKVIEEPQNQEGCRNQESCKDKRYCEKQIKSLSDKLSKLKQNESEIDENPTITADLDRLMLKDGESSVEDLKNLNNLDSSNSFIADLEEGATTSDLDNVMNTVNDEDIMPDSEGALNDGDDIDSLNESSLKFL